MLMMSEGLGVVKGGKGSAHEAVTFLKPQAGKLSAAAFFWLQQVGSPGSIWRLQLHKTISPSPSWAWVMSLQGHRRVWGAVSWVAVSVCVVGAAHNLLKKYRLTLSLRKPTLRGLRMRHSQSPLQTYYGV